MKNMTRTLGEDSELLYIHDIETLLPVVLSMSQQAHRHIRLFSHDLDRTIFTSKEIVEAFTRLAASSPHAYIHILLQNTSGLIHQGHPLLGLARRISSYIEIRVTDIMHRNIEGNFYLFDDEGWVRRDHPKEYHGEANFSDSRNVRDFGHRFTTMWEQGDPDPHLRRMNI
jgi:hypothetical protein